MDIFKGIVRFFFNLFAPIITIAIGAAVAAWGGSMDNEIVMYVGGALIVAGLIWGVLAYAGALDL